MKRLSLIPLFFSVFPDEHVQSGNRQDLRIVCLPIENNTEDAYIKKEKRYKNTKYK